MTDDDIQQACARHGAKRVSDAAYFAMEGPRGPLDAVGLGHAEGVDALLRITERAFELMSPVEQAAELSNATITGGRLPG